MVSAPAFLKVTEMVMLVMAIVMFVLSNKCSSNGSYVTLYVLPCAVCASVTLVTYVTALLMLTGGRNPLVTSTWVKGEVYFNVAGMVVMVVGSIITLTNKACSDTPLTITSIALGFISAVLFVCSAAITYLKMVHYQEKMKAQNVQLQKNRITLSVIT